MLYEFLKENKKVVDTLVNKGVLPIDVVNKIQIYDDYRSVSNRTTKVEAIKIVSDKYRCCDRTVRRTIDWMEK